MKPSKQTISIVIACVMAVILFVSPAMAKEVRPNFKEHFENMVQELKLSPDQVQKLKDLRKEKSFKETRKANQQKMMDLRKKIVEEFANENYDQAKIENYKNQILTLMKEGIDAHTAHLVKMRGILTPEQFKKFHEIKEKQFKKMMRPEPGIE